MKIYYNKLVRDKIPQIFIDENKVPKIKILNDEEYIKTLNLKLIEEVKEYVESGNIEELADIEEVLRAILKFKCVSLSKFNAIRKEKVFKRGAFKNKVFLESVESKK